jgi:hypothetical protein
MRRNRRRIEAERPLQGSNRLTRLARTKQAKTDEVSIPSGLRLLLESSAEKLCGAGRLVVLGKPRADFCIACSVGVDLQPLGE